MAQPDQPDVEALLAEAKALATEVCGSPDPQPAEPRASQAAPPPPGAARSEFSSAPPEVQRLLKLQVPVIVQLAARSMNMQDVLELNVSSIIEFERPCDAELDLIVSNRQIGLGHAVKVGENFGLRVTRIGSIYDTIKALGG